MRRSLHFPSIILCSVFFIVAGCTDATNPVGAQLDAAEKASQPVEIPSLERAATTKSAQPSATLSKSSSEAVYTFDDLPVECLWDHEFPETYHDLTFSGSRYIAPCALEGDVGIVPVSIDHQTEQTQTNIALPRPATEVSISYFGYMFHHRARVFVAYDESGVEIDRASATSDGTWGRLTVTGTIHEVAIIDYQSQTIWDDLSVTFGSSNEAPIAEAVSVDMVIVSESVSLDGSLSSDPDGDAITYTWEWSSRPAGSASEISDPAAAVTAFVADEAGTYGIRLIVNDGVADSDPDEVEVVALSVTGSVAALQDDVSRLYARGALTGGQANSLLQMLDFVKENTDAKPHSALNKLDAFASHVSGMADGALSPEQADALIEYSIRIANAIKSQSASGVEAESVEKLRRGAARG